jgi:hypothetical protein
MNRREFFLAGEQEIGMIRFITIQKKLQGRKIIIQ